MKSKLRIRFADPIRTKITRAVAASAFIVLAVWFVPCSFAQQHNQRTFHSAEDASLALFTAAQQENDRALLEILGTGGKDLISSGDPAEDAGSIDPLIASAGQEKTATTSAGDLAASDPIPFKGYYFRILTRQGENASGGAKTYVVDGNMLRGFAFIAYPAEYRSSGVMTFIVNDDGALYEKDLGPNTAQQASAMTEYNPDSTWHRVD